MKYIIVLGDGMADEPMEELGGLTPLEAASTPHIDDLARRGRMGRLTTVPEGFHPGSEIANLTILGYDVNRVYEGRGSLEAASMGVGIAAGEMAMRCNIVCVTPDGVLKNHSAGHISTPEAVELIHFLQERLGDDEISFHPGVSYRHLLKLRGGDKRIDCTPPHDCPGTPIADIMIKPLVEEARPTAQRLNDLIAKSQELLKDHPVNLRRISEGKDPANSIWPWSPGYKPEMTTMGDLFGIRNGVVISAVDLIKGIGVYAGLRPIGVEGATGLYDTNYEGKVNAAIEALENGADFVFLHIEASDEAGHEGNIGLKIKTIENLDSRIVGPLMDAVNSHRLGDDVSIAVLPDHPTPCRLRTHTGAPVPFVIWRSGMNGDLVEHFSERSAGHGSYGLVDGKNFIRIFLSE